MKIKFSFLSVTQAQKLVLPALNHAILTIAQLSKKRVNSHLPRIESRLKNIRDIYAQLEHRYQDLELKPDVLYDSLAAAKDLEAKFVHESTLLKDALAIESGAKDTFIRVTLNMAKVTTIKNSKVLTNNQNAESDKNRELLSLFSAIKSKKDEIDSKYAVILAAFSMDKPSDEQNKDAEAALSAILVLVKQFDIMAAKFTTQPQSEYMKFLAESHRKGLLDEDSPIGAHRKDGSRYRSPNIRV
jgi:hypothetical protein